MTTAITVTDILFVCTALALLPSIFFLVELVFGLKKHSQRHFSQTNLKCAILIPAHNEELVIENALKSIKSQLIEGDRVIVIADNCDDSTAEIAKRQGCEAIVRQNEEHRGKGFALAFGLQHLRSNPPDIVMILDADCHAAQGSIQTLKSACAELNQPVQANYQIRSSCQENVRGKITEFAVYIKNHIRLRGLDRLGGSIPITGSGFAIPYELIKDVDLASGEIVEDMKLGVDLALSGHKVRYVPEALITSVLPTAEEAATSQHKRWEHGHISIMVRYFPILIRKALTRRSWALFMTALDMGVPPFLILTAMNICLLGATLVFALLFSDIPSSLLVISILSFQAIALLLVNYSSEQARLGRHDIVNAIEYLAGKADIYKSLAKRKKSGWVKTSR